MCETSQLSPLGIVIPTKWPAQWISDAVSSAVDQTYENVRVVVVWDGGHPPWTFTWERHPRVVSLLLEESQGPSGARNAGMGALDDCELITLLDSDDVLGIDHVSAAAHYMEANPDCVAVGAPCLEMSAEGNVLRMQRGKTRNVTRSLFVRNQLTNSGTTVRRSVFVDAGMYNTDVRACEDYELAMRMAMRGEVHVSESLPLVRYRRHAGGISNEGLSQESLNVVRRSRRELGTYLGLPPRLADLIQTLWELYLSLRR